MPTKVVNRPTDPKQKEQNINQKLQWFGIYHAFTLGKLPSNKQCDVAMNSALASKALTAPSKDLSEEGQKLVKDVREVVDQARKLILSKNDGQLLQDFIWQAQRLGDVEAKKPGAPLTKDSAKQDGTNAVEGIKTLGTLLVTNGEFRKILSDALVLVRDMAGDASQAAANKVRPSEDQLSQIDQPAEDGVWHEKPDFASHKDQLKSRFRRNKGDGASEVSSAGAGDVGSQASRKSVKDRAREASGKAKEYLSDKVPQQRRDQAIWRLKKMLMEIQGHSDYQRAIETMLNLVEKYGGHGREVSQQGTGVVKDVRGHETVHTIETNLRLLLERFANSTSLDDLFDSLETVYRDAEKDPELRGWFKNIDSFIRKCLQEQGYIMEDACTREWGNLYDHGRYLLRDRYKEHTNRVLDEIKFFGEQYNKDAQNKAFGESVERLFLDLGRDPDGKMAFKKHLLKDIGTVILPAAFEHIRYVPIPRIEVKDPAVDVVIENLVIESDNLMPNVLEFGSDNYFRWGRKKISNKRDNKVMISASGIQADLTDVSYYLKKKQGFPAITDTGIMDIFLGGEGFGFKAAASIPRKEDREQFIRLDKIDVKIDKLDIKLRKSKHKLLFQTFKPLLFRIVRPVLEKVVAQKIREAFANGDNFAKEIHLEAKKAQDNAKKANPEDETSIYSRYAEVFRKKMDQKKQAAQAEAKRDTKVQASATLRDSQFPDIKLPGGLTTKATEYAERAEKGEGWQSDIFSIGSAGESKDIPAPEPVTRKSPRSRAASAGGGAAGGSTAAAATTAGGAGGAAGTSGAAAGGFTDEINNAFNAGTNGANGANGAKASAPDGAPAVTGTPSAFNPQTA